jgi:hypothetical protein
MMTDEDTVARGHRAASEYRELEAAFKRIEDAYLAELLKAPMGADDRILGLHMAIQNLRGVEAVLKNFISSGQIAQELIGRAEKARL